MGGNPVDAPRRTALAAVFAVATVAGVWRLIVELTDSAPDRVWAHTVRVIACVVMIAAGVGGLAALRRPAGAPDVPGPAASADDDRRPPTRVPAVTNTSLLTVCGLLLALAVMTLIEFFPDEPAALRVAAGTGMAVCGLWLLAALASKAAGPARR